jgi:hypothetical protein
MKTYTDLETLLRENNIPTTYLEEAIQKGMDSKKTWLDQLELNKANDFRAVLPIPQTLESLPLAFNFLQGLNNLEPFKIIDFQYLQVGKNKVKTTKVISRNWDNIDVLTSYIELFNEINAIKVNNGQKEIENTLSAFLIAWGDYTKNGMVAVVSANSWDYLVLSDSDGRHCAFSSCVRYNDNGGEYFNTCLYYLASPSVFIGYTAEKDDLDRKIGRIIIYVGGLTAVSTGRRYGSISDGTVIAMRDYCQQKLSDKQLPLDTIPQCSRWIVKSGTISDNHAISNKTGAYVDTGYGEVTVKKDCELEPCIIEQGFCLDCGNKLYREEQGGVCEDCRGDSLSCRHCGDHIHEDDGYFYCDDAYCNSCFCDLFGYCEDCEEYFPQDELYEVHTDHRNTAYVCEHCRSSNYTQCNDCEEYFFNKGVTETNGGDYVCEKCLEEYTSCEECGSYTKDFTEVNDDYYCNDCLETKFKECSACGDWTPKDELKDGLYDNCQPEKEGLCEQSLTA